MLGSLSPCEGFVSVLIEHIHRLFVAVECLSGEVSVACALPLI
jgi:hypothetical protein